MDQVWLPFLLMVRKQGKTMFSLSPLAPEKLVSPDGFGHPVLREPGHSLHSG